MIWYMKKALIVSVETCFPLERGNRGLKVPFGSGRNRISHVSCILEMKRVENDVPARYAVRVPVRDEREEGWYRDLCRPYV